MLKVYASRVLTGHGAPGEVLSAGKEGLEVACGNGSLLITELQAAGSKRLNAAAYLAGHPIDCGTLLGRVSP
jgi:methionyl-tRNA formyltransferase